jgi:hypothetical protein
MVCGLFKLDCDEPVSTMVPVKNGHENHLCSKCGHYHFDAPVIGPDGKETSCAIEQECRFTGKCRFKKR